MPYTEAGEFAGGFVVGAYRAAKRPRLEDSTRMIQDTSLSVYTKHRFGYGKRRKLPLWKTVKGSEQWGLYRFGKYLSFINSSQPWYKVDSTISYGASGNTNMGAYPLLSANFGDPLSYWAAPLMLFDLTCLPYNNIGGGKFGNPMYQMCTYGVNSAAEQVFFRRVLSEGNAQAVDETTDDVTRWIALDIAGTGATAANEIALRNCILNYVKFKFMVRGCASWPAHVRFDLVQFSEDYMHPEQWVSDAPAAPWGTNQPDQVLDTYSQLVRPYTVGPMAAGTEGRRELGNVKFLKTWVVETEPVGDYESSVASAYDKHTKQVDISCNLNRICRFDWETYQDRDGATMNVTTADAYARELGSNDVYVHPNARIYLMIRGSAYNTFSGAIDPRQIVSFDMIASRKQTMVR